MQRQFTGADEPSNIISDGFVEVMWETLIALATVAAICISVISLAAHLNDARTIRDGAENGTHARHTADTRLPSGIAGLGVRDTSRFD
jgi:hypothetical protein